MSKLKKPMAEMGINAVDLLGEVVPVHVEETHGRNGSNAVDLPSEVVSCPS